MIDDFSFALGVIWGALVVIAWGWLFSACKKLREAKEDERTETQ